MKFFFRFQIVEEYEQGSCMMVKIKDLKTGNILIIPLTKYLMNRPFYDNVMVMEDDED